jgi:uncharacterized membrane protein
MANQQWTILLSVTFFRWRFNGVRVTPYLAFCVVFCCQLVSFSVFLFILAIAMSVLGITASYYPIYLQRFLDRNILHQLRDICSIYRWCSNFLHINGYWKKKSSLLSLCFVLNQTPCQYRHMSGHKAVSVIYP